MYVDGCHMLVDCLWHGEKAGIGCGEALATFIMQKKRMRECVFIYYGIRLRGICLEGKSNQ